MCVFAHSVKVLLTTIEKIGYKTMQTIPEFTIKDLVIKPDDDYANYEGKNRVFIIFVTVSPEMAKLNEGDNFLYEGDTYRIVMRTLPDAKHPKSVQSDAHDSKIFSPTLILLRLFNLIV
jgi:hypothetical protein